MKITAPRRPLQGTRFAAQRRPIAEVPNGWTSRTPTAGAARPHQPDDQVDEDPQRLEDAELQLRARRADHDMMTK